MEASTNMNDNTISFTPEPQGQENVAATQPIMNSTMVFDQPKENSCHIKVIGVGGGGGNTVNHMYTQGIHGVDFIVCNTDKKALNDSPVPNKIVLGELGAGNKPERARKAAIEHRDEIRDAISNNTQMLFITAGMGGGTGTGAAPVIAEIAKSIELDDEDVPRILVVAIVTTPFKFEGKPRKRQAEAGIEELRKHVDAILIINNDKLRDYGNMTFDNAFIMANDVLLTAAKGIAEIITRSAHVNIDFRDVNTVMANSGTALMGAGEGNGENRAIDAIKAATTSVLLDDNDIRGAKNVLLFFSYSPNHKITMDELGEMTDFISDLIGDEESNVIWGTGDDDSIVDDTLKITLIATGFVPKPEGSIIPLEPENEINTTPVTSEPVSTTSAATAVAEIAAPKPFDAPEPQPTAQAGDPFTQPANNGEKRFFVLEETPEMEEEKYEEPVAQQPSAPKLTGIDMIDGISVRTQTPATATMEKPVAQSVATGTTVVFETAEVATAEQRTPSPFDSIRPQAPKPAPAPMDNYNEVMPQVEQAFQPQNDNLTMQTLDRKERIKKMNELLHNNPDYPRILETLTMEELSSEQFATNYSSVREAGKSHIDANGNITTSMDFYTNLPD
ncbi:MAG: cell division protein FtsZ [Bacteroidales bacterium]|nr:cell division protein FtsZ [Bacteroidales bacterium]